MLGKIFLPCSSKRVRKNQVPWSSKIEDYMKCKTKPFGTLVATLQLFVHQWQATVHGLNRTQGGQFVV